MDAEQDTPGGFRIADNTCVQAKYLGSVVKTIKTSTLAPRIKKTRISVYSMDAMMALPAPWEKMVQKTPADTVAANATVSNTSGNVFGPITIKFYICQDPNMREESDMTRVAHMCKRQVRKMNIAYSGRSQCQGPMVYTPHFADAKVTFKPFEDDDLGVIRHSRCNMADTYYEDIWHDAMPAERGFHKVLLGGSGNYLLGVSAFPTDSIRGTMIAMETMPGGNDPPYNQGDTLVHETGHFLGLYHTFQGGCIGQGDAMDDTPAEDAPYFGCPAAHDQPASCISHESAPVHNYMDYSDDSCMCHFTEDQVSRIQSNIPTYIM
jgi:hypothetical protein